jgi:hypothetical protein
VQSSPNTAREKRKAKQRDSKKCLRSGGTSEVQGLISDTEPASAKQRDQNDCGPRGTRVRPRYPARDGGSSAEQRQSKSLMGLAHALQSAFSANSDLVTGPSSKQRPSKFLRPGARHECSPARIQRERSVKAKQSVTPNDCGPGWHEEFRAYSARVTGPSTKQPQPYPAAKRAARVQSSPNTARE